MKKIIWIALAVAAAGCAGGAVKSERDGLSGHWAGAIDREGWQRPLSLDIQSGNSGYAGSWMSLESQPGVMLQRIERDGESVRFELPSLVFQGKLAGRTLVGTVAERTGQSSGQFVLTRIDPMSATINLGSYGP